MSNDNFAEKIRSIIDGLDRDGDKKVFPDNPNVPKFRIASIPTAEGECLRKWVIKENATNTIEIGLAFGFSALHIGEGLMLNDVVNPRHVVIDPFQVQENKYASMGLNILGEAGLGEIIEFYGEKSQVILSSFLNEGRKFDLAFVDGNHLFDYVFLDLFYLGQLVKNGGIIFVDDYDKPGIRKAVTFFIKNLDWKIEESGSEKNREWLIMRTSENGDTRDWQNFIDF